MIQQHNTEEHEQRSNLKPSEKKIKASQIDYMLCVRCLVIDF